MWSTLYSNGLFSLPVNDKIHFVVGLAHLLPVLLQPIQTSFKSSVNTCQQSSLPRSGVKVKSCLSESKTINQHNQLFCWLSKWFHRSLLFIQKSWSRFSQERWYLSNVKSGPNSYTLKEPSHAFNLTRKCYCFTTILLWFPAVLHHGFTIFSIFLSTEINFLQLQLGKQLEIHQLKKQLLTNITLDYMITISSFLKTH